MGGRKFSGTLPRGEGNFLNFGFLQLENTARLDATRNLLNAILARKIESKRAGLN